MVKNKLVFLVSALSLLFAYTGLSRAQDNFEFDQPGSENTLNRQLWEFAKGTPYGSVEAYVAKAQAKSREAMSDELQLPTGWKISPAGKQVGVGRLPYEAIVYNSRLVVLNTGFYSREPQVVSVIDPSSGVVEKTVKINSMFPSAIVGDDGGLYISGGFDFKVYRLDNSFNVERSYKVDGYAAGLAPVDKDHIAVVYLVADNSAGRYGKGKIAILNTNNGDIDKEVTVGYFPYSAVFVDGKLYVSLLGENKVKVYDRQLNELKSIEVGIAPGNMTVDGNSIYVVNTNSDNISVINPGTDRVTRTIFVGRGHHDSGVSPTSCAVEGGRLYVSEATLNAIAIYDLKNGRLLGYIPTGWYPTKVLIDNGNLYYLSAKGILPRRPNLEGPQPVAGKGGPEYVLTLLKGTAGILPENSIDRDIHGWTKDVEYGSPIYGLREGLKVPIKHIFYIIKENRSYDQVLGDLGRGNGDSSLTIFGREITPNIHKMATDFVTLDNFYVDGEISVLGHSFTTSGYASPFLEWLGNADYCGKYKGYPFGTVPAAFSRNYIWDALDAEGVDYKVYGEPYYLMTAAYKIIVKYYGQDSEMAEKFYANSMELAAKVDRGKEFSDFVEKFYGRANNPKEAFRLLGDEAFTQGISKIFTGDETLQNALRQNVGFRKAFAVFLYHYPLNYYTWDLKYSDLRRFEAWRTDFNEQLKSGKVVPFEYIWLPNDHTAGTNPNYPNPYQLVSENDAALGLIVQTIAHSPIWKNSLILVEEDDAQNGPDHVDATRTEALAVGPYVKRNAVVSDRYDQLSMLRTIEVILGLDPLNFGDAMAVPMYGIFTSRPDFHKYTAAAPSDKLAESDRQLYNQIENK